MPCALVWPQRCITVRQLRIIFCNLQKPGNFMAGILVPVQRQDRGVGVLGSLESYVWVADC